MNGTISRLSKNTVFLYVRMIVLMVITLYTSRVLLNTLGVNDFGIYSVVGSVTATFCSLRSVFSEAIQRFLNYEKGKGNLEAEKQVFNIAVVLHLVIAAVFMILVETVGLWLLKSKLVIEPDRLEAAYYVFHYSVLASVFSILIIPFDALIIANEKMNVYAWVSILDGVAKLIVVLFLPLIGYDYLKTYSFLLAVIPFVNILIYFVYCRKFPECRYNFKINKGRIKEVFSFSGWSFGGNLFYTFAHEGLNIVINLFGGVINNAARNIAYQIRSAVNQVSNNTLLATKPFILQSAAEKSNEELLSYVIKITRANFFIMLMTCLPIVSFCSPLLNIWLVNVPEKSVIVTQLVTVSVLIRCLHGPLNLYYMGVGQIKRMVLLESFILFILVPVCYLEMRLGQGLTCVYLTLCIAELLIIIALTWNIKYEFKVAISSFCRRALLPSVELMAISFPFAFICSNLCVGNVIVEFILCITLMIITAIMIYSFYLNDEEKMLASSIYMKINNKIKRK